MISSVLLEACRGFLSSEMFLWFSVFLLLWCVHTGACVMLRTRQACGRPGLSDGASLWWRRRWWWGWESSWVKEGWCLQPARSSTDRVQTNRPHGMGHRCVLFLHFLAFNCMFNVSDVITILIIFSSHFWSEIWIHSSLKMSNVNTNELKSIKAFIKFDEFSFIYGSSVNLFACHHFFS